MRVAVVMPMAPESAVADVTLQAVETLAGSWDIDVWCPAAVAYRACPVELHPFDAPDARVVENLSRYDLVVFVVGDGLVHVPIIPLVRRVPGLVVMHDVSITNSVVRAARAHGGWSSLVAAVNAEQPEDLAQIVVAGDTSVSAARWAEVSDAVPLHEVVTRSALGVVVHSAWHAARIGDIPLGEVTVAPHVPPVGHSAHSSWVADADTDARLAALAPDDVLLVTVGAANANRRLDLLVAALDQPAASRVHLHVVGHANDQQVHELRAVAVRHGVEERVVSTGPVSDAALAAILARADIGAALRAPVLEGQSASMITQMQAGLPVLVLDHAHYAELPQGVAVPVDPDDAAASVRRAVGDLAGDPGRRRSIGAAAAEHVATTRTGQAYAAVLGAAGERALAARPLARLTASMGHLLRQRDLHTQPAVVERVAALTEGLGNLFEP